MKEHKGILRDAVMWVSNTGHVHLNGFWEEGQYMLSTSRIVDMEVQNDGSLAVETRNSFYRVYLADNRLRN